jgi:membrane protein
MFWLWLSVFLVIVGATVNAESERQTARDSTVGPERPPGTRGAVVADTVPPLPGEPAG